MLLVLSQTVPILTIALYSMFPPLKGANASFWWHPFLFTVAFCAQAIGALIMKQRKPVFNYHLATASISSTCTFLSAYLIYQSRTNGHFHTWHGLIGVVAWASYAFLVTCSSLFLFPGFLKNMMARNTRRKLHNTGAKWILFIFATNILVGLDKTGMGVSAGALPLVFNILIVTTAVSTIVRI